ncbi:MAG TPA: hypothetical protein VN369_05985, partial [Terriglobales bacterium]|nr:hypothetical protein [Terriglobales bacterium]
MEDFDRWSNKKKEQEAFAKWSDEKASAAKLMQPAQPVATNYSAPFYGAGEPSRPLPVADEGRRASGRHLGILEGAPPTAQNPLVATGDSARAGVERTQPTEKPPAQPEKKKTPINQRNKITLHPGVEKVDAAAKAAQSQRQSQPAPQPQAKAPAPVTPTGQALRLGEL